MNQMIMQIIIVQIQDHTVLYFGAIERFCNKEGHGKEKVLDIPTQVPSIKPFHYLRPYFSRTRRSYPTLFYPSKIA